MTRPAKDQLDELIEWNLAGSLAAGILELPRGKDGGFRTPNGHDVVKLLARQPE
jgi:hypothetical protein